MGNVERVSLIFLLYLFFLRIQSLQQYFPLLNNHFYVSGLGIFFYAFPNVLDFL